MIAVGEHRTVRQLVHRAMRKGVAGAPQPLRREHRVVRDGAEREDCANARPCRQLGGEKRPAGADLDRVRLVLRRHAAHRVGDAGAAQRQPVLRMGAVITLGKPELQQGPIEQIAGKIAGERSPGPVGAPQTRRQADDQERRYGIAEGGDRGVEPVGMRRALDRPEAGQPRAERAVAVGQLRGSVAGQGSRLSVTRSRPARRGAAPSRRADDGCA